MSLGEFQNSLTPEQRAELFQLLRAYIHITQLATAKSNGKLEMKLGTAINIVASGRFPHLSSEDWGLVLGGIVAELNKSSDFYDHHNIR